jgi:hypothetical protein
MKINKYTFVVVALFCAAVFFYVVYRNLVNDTDLTKSSFPENTASLFENKEYSKLVSATSPIIQDNNWAVSSQSDFDMLVIHVNSLIFLDEGYTILKSQDDYVNTLGLFLNKTSGITEDSDLYGQFLHQIVYVLTQIPFTEKIRNLISNDPRLASIYAKSIEDSRSLNIEISSTYFQSILSKNLSQEAEKTYRNKLTTSRAMAGIYIEAYFKSKVVGVDEGKLVMDTAATAILKEYQDFKGLTKSPDYSGRVHAVTNDYFIAWYLYLANKQLNRNLQDSVSIFYANIVDVKNTDTQFGLKNAKAYNNLYAAVMNYESDNGIKSLSDKQKKEIKISSIKNLLDPVILSPNFISNGEYSDIRSYILKSLSSSGPTFDRVSPMLKYMIEEDAEYKTRLNLQK